MDFVFNSKMCQNFKVQEEKFKRLLAFVLRAIKRASGRILILIKASES